MLLGTQFNLFVTLRTIKGTIKSNRQYKRKMTTTQLYKSTFDIPGMDCPCEENLIRLRLESDSSIESLYFDLAERTLVVIHYGEVVSIREKLDTLNLGAVLVDSSISDEAKSERAPSLQRRILYWVLGINFLFFIVEMAAGLLSNSMGLVADSLDMLADALVYGMSLMAIGATELRKKRVAKVSGYLQIMLAVLGLMEIIKRFIGLEGYPDPIAMIAIAFFALIANSLCLWLLQKTKSKEAHIQASVIFSANDVIINIGVIIAGLLVWLLNSYVPDLIIGVIVFLIVIRGAIGILNLSE